jgi:hypothetical protein
MNLVDSNALILILKMLSMFFANILGKGKKSADSGLADSETCGSPWLSKRQFIPALRLFHIEVVFFAFVSVKSHSKH